MSGGVNISSDMIAGPLAVRILSDPRGGTNLEFRIAAESDLQVLREWIKFKEISIKLSVCNIFIVPQIKVMGPICKSKYWIS